MIYTMIPVSAIPGSFFSAFVNLCSLCQAFRQGMMKTLTSAMAIPLHNTFSIVCHHCKEKDCTPCQRSAILHAFVFKTKIVYFTPFKLCEYCYLWVSLHSTQPTPTGVRRFC